MFFLRQKGFYSCHCIEISSHHIAYWVSTTSEPAENALHKINLYKRAGIKEIHQAEEPTLSGSYTNEVGAGFLFLSTAMLPSPC